MCVFDGVVDAEAYVMIPERTLQFILQVYLDHHWFMQDNVPKHTSRGAQEFFEENRID